MANGMASGEGQLWQRLKTSIQDAIASFNGVAGICIRDLATGHGFGIHADDVFPTASTIKIHILTQLLLRAEQGEIDLAHKIALICDACTGGSGVLTHLEGDVQLSLHDLAILMIIVSDNTATNLCIDLAGFDAVNALLDDLGLHWTRLQRKMMDHEPAKQDVENIATPAELVEMLGILYRGKPTPHVAEQVLSILRKPKNGFLNRALPPDLPLANKPGYTTGVRCDAGIVYTQRRPYAVAIMCKYGMDTPWQQDRFVEDLARWVHETMVMLDGSNAYGHAIFV